MKSQKPNDKNKTGKITQLKTENKDLQDKKKSDKAALDKLDKELTFEKRYQESQSRFETIFYKSTLGNKIITPDLKIIQINEVVQQMLGYSKEEIIGAGITKFAHPDFIHHWHELQENLWTKQIPSFQMNTCLVKKDGSNFWCQVTSILFRDDADNLGYTILQDISERKTLELNLKKLYDYQETIMHMVAHDLKSPINNIKLLSGFLQADLAKMAVVKNEKDPEILTFITMISEACDNAFAIIRDLLIIGEFKSNEAFEKTDLKIYIKSQLALLGVEARKKEIAINFNFPEEPVFAYINQDKFTRVLENLLSNAVKFTNAHGQVTICLKNEDRKVMLQVKDNGIGIPENMQASIFDKFTKASRKGTAGETTTGLGLYIVKEIVDIHKGKIWMESLENEGTSFYIELT